MFNSSYYCAFFHGKNVTEPVYCQVLHRLRQPSAAALHTVRLSFTQSAPCPQLRVLLFASFKQNWVSFRLQTHIWKLFFSLPCSKRKTKHPVVINFLRVQNLERAPHRKLHTHAYRLGVGGFEKEGKDSSIYHAHKWRLYFQQIFTTHWEEGKRNTIVKKKRKKGAAEASESMNFHINNEFSYNGQRGVRAPLHFGRLMGNQMEGASVAHCSS